MIIQIVGLPGVGKSTLINKFKNQSTVDFKALDIRNFHAPNREEKLINSICKKQNKYIIESACGIDIEPSIVILIKQNKFNHKKQLQSRGEVYDEYDLQAIDDQIIPANYTVYNSKVFCELLNYLLM